MAALCGRDWGSLQHLVLNGNRLGCEGLEWLVKADMPALEYLHMSHNFIGIEGCRILRQCRWPALKELGLNSVMA